MKVIYLFFVFLFFSCAQEKKDSYRIPKDYRLWSKPYSKIIDYPVPGHGKTFRVIYANEKARHVKVVSDKIFKKRYIYPAGSVFINEIYSQKEDVNMKDPELAVMIKADDDSRANIAGWMYYSSRPGQKNASPVKGDLCVGCHEAANESHSYFGGNPHGFFCDFIFTDPL